MPPDSPFQGGGVILNILGYKGGRSSPPPPTSKKKFLMKRGHHVYTTGAITNHQITTASTPRLPHKKMNDRFPLFASLTLFPLTTETHLILRLPEAKIAYLSKLLSEFWRQASDKLTLCLWFLLSCE